MKNQIDIVPFSSALREHFYRINAAWLIQYFHLEAIDLKVLKNPEQEIIEPGGAIFFAKIGPQVIGTCALKLEREGYFELTKMGVDEGFQGFGVGQKLIDAAIAEFKRRAGKELFLESSRKLAPALRLYERAGFEHQPHTKSGSLYSRADVYMIWRDPTAK